MAEAVVLGSGTSHGVPTIGYEYTDAFLANSKNHRWRSGLLIRGYQGNIVVDCSPEFRLQMLREDVRTIEAIILTHTHADHMMGMDDLRAYSDRLGELPLLTLPDHFDIVRQVFPYAFRTPPPGLTFPRFDLRAIQPVEHIAGLEIQTFTVLHGTQPSAMPVIGLRIGDFGYVTDVKTVPEPAFEAVQGVKTLLLDGLRPRPHPSHFNFEEAIAFARKVGAERTYLTHLTHDVDHDVTEATLPEGIFLAYDGIRLPINE